MKDKNSYHRILDSFFFQMFFCKKKKKPAVVKYNSHVKLHNPWEQ